MIYESNIKLGGNDYRIVASMGVFIRYEKYFGKQLNEVMTDENQLKSITFFFELVYSAISNPKISFDEFCDTISPSELEEIVKIGGDIIVNLQPDKAQNTALKN